MTGTNGVDGGGELLKQMREKVAVLDPESKVRM